VGGVWLGTNLEGCTPLLIHCNFYVLLYQVGPPQNTQLNMFRQV